VIEAIIVSAVRTPISMGAADLYEVEK